LLDVCKKNNWHHSKSPIVWRELVNRGGKEMLLGDVNDFQEYVKGYYDIVLNLTSNDLKAISNENQHVYEEIREEFEKERNNIRSIKLTISYPESAAFYFAMAQLLNGNVFGQNELLIDLYLYSRSGSASLEGVKMEIEDLASSKLRSIRIVNNCEEAFKNCDFVLIFDELIFNDSKFHDESQPEVGNFSKIYSLNTYIELAKSIDKFAKPSCKILITPFGSRFQISLLTNLVGKYLQNIDFQTNLMGNSLYAEMHLKSVLARRLNVNPANIRDVFVLGESLTSVYCVDLSHGQVTNYDGAVWAREYTYWRDLVKIIADRDWIKNEFINSIEKLGIFTIFLKYMLLLFFLFFYYQEIIILLYNQIST
jgi:hypothetical protein